MSGSPGAEGKGLSSQISDLRSKMRIRKYLETDREHCLAVFDSNVPEEFGAGERAEYEAFLDAPPGPYWVVEEQWRIVGCGGVALEPDGTAGLRWGMVQRGRQGEGWGRYLLGAQLAWVRRETGHRRVVARVSGRARDLFEHHGFVVAGAGPEAVGAAAGRPAAGPGADRRGTGAGAVERLIMAIDRT